MDNHYDIYEPRIGHFNRFQAKINLVESPQKRNWYKYIAVAASIILIFTFAFKGRDSNGLDLADISPKMEETQDYFTTVIHKELEEIAKIKNVQNEKIINDAFAQLQLLENDYNKQKIDLARNSKNKTIIYVMINNYQQRIQVLENLLNQLDEFNTIHTKYEINNL